MRNSTKFWNLFSNKTGEFSFAGNLKACPQMTSIRAARFFSFQTASVFPVDLGKLSKLLSEHLGLNLFAADLIREAGL